MQNASSLWTRLILPPVTSRIVAPAESVHAPGACPVPEAQAQGEPAAPEELTLDSLTAGQRAIISCLRCPHIASCNRLMAYGLTQGQSVLLVQKHPAFVIRVDETELALDEFVARCIHVFPAEP